MGYSRRGAIGADRRVISDVLPKPDVKPIGAKQPLSPSHIWSIRTKLQIDERIRDLAMFNLAIANKLPGCDAVALKVEDLAPNGYATPCRGAPKKAGRPVR